MRFSADFLDEIRSRVPISAVVGTHVTFDRKKTNISRGDFWACCPFHAEKTPSFHCDDRRGRYHCFSCGVSGDHFRFLSELKGLAFYEAVERLADMAGISMPSPDPETEKREVERAALYGIMELAAKFFEQLLQKDEGASARAYLRGRALSPRVQKMFHLGYAADSRKLLKEFLIAKGVGSRQLEASGLLVSGDDVSVSYDRFRNRIMFPIENARGRIVGFGGRALSSATKAKYLNSPETELFRKGCMLYNFPRARRASQSVDEAGGRPIIVVEGYMDVIALAGVGFEETVAPLGTALTKDQLQLLWRYSSQPVLCFDGDEAGRNAALRALDRALPLIRAGVSLNFVLLPQGRDPDDVICEGGKQFFNELLGQAVPLAEMLWQRETQGQVFETPESRAALEKRLHDAAFTIKDGSLRYYYLQDIRERMRVFFKPSPFVPFLKERKTNRYDNRQSTTPGRLYFSESLIHSELVENRGEPILMREAAILVTLASHPQLWNENFETLALLEFGNRDLVELHCAMLDILAEWHPNDADSMFRFLDKKGKSAIMARIMQFVRDFGMRSAFTVAPIEDARVALKQALYLYQRGRYLYKELREIETEILNNPDSNIFSLLNGVKNELERVNATDVLIEGFGLWDVDANH
ncbi:MAG: DNA primase [Candidatus Tokpelaia sp. JSC189]|nr:MAG: DNA primase [Candidatus Tokpelaia sp. JSC189]